LRYSPDPPTVEEIIAVMRAGGETVDGLGWRGLMVVLWRAGLRISEALALAESDLDPQRGAILIRRGKGGKRREVQLRNAAARAGVRRRFASHQLRHAHAVEMSREGVPLVVIQRQLGHAHLGITSVYLRGIDNTEIIHTVHQRPAHDPSHQRTWSIALTVRKSQTH
jgi:site-specific recombinase XerD